MQWRGEERIHSDADRISCLYGLFLWDGGRETDEDDRENVWQEKNKKFIKEKEHQKEKIRVISLKPW